MTLPQDTGDLSSKMRAAVHANWKAFLIEGILLVILGLAAMVVPPLGPAHPAHSRTSHPIRICTRRR